MVPGTAAIPELASWGERLENVRRFFPRIKVIIVLFLWRLFYTTGIYINTFMKSELFSATTGLLKNQSTDSVPSIKG